MYPPTELEIFLTQGEGLSYDGLSVTGQAGKGRPSYALVLDGLGL